MANGTCLRKGKGVDEIVKTLKTFLTRDLIYIVAGSVVLGAGYYWIRPALRVGDIPQSGLLIILGLGHFTGFACQSLGNFLRITNVGPLNKPGSIVLLLYRRSTRKDTWYAPDEMMDTQFTLYADERTQAEIDRIITLKHIAATMAPCAAAVCLLVLAKCVTCHTTGTADLALMAGFGFLLLVLAPMSYVLSAEQTQFVVEKALPERIRQRAYSVWESDKTKTPEICWDEAKQALLAEAKRSAIGGIRR